MQGNAVLSLDTEHDISIEHPILFNRDMIRAILEGRKTQTRRIIKNLPEHVEVISHVEGNDAPGVWNIISSDQPRYTIKCPFGKPGDRLWARENVWIAPHGFANKTDSDIVDDQGRPRTIGYSATMDLDSVRFAKEYGVKQSPSIHMPRWACRITLEIIDIRVERLQDITETDAIAEGVSRHPWSQNHWHHYVTNDMQVGCMSAKQSYESLWQKINGAKS